MANDKSEVTNVIVKNLELHWAKLVKPVDPFGTLQWEIQVRFPAKRQDEMSEYGTPKAVKDVKGMMQMNFKKKAELADGSPAKPVKVVGKSADEVIDPRTIGNGSKGNVKLMLKPYEIKGPKGNVTKRGTSVMLVGVQVTELIEFVPKNDNDFDFDDVSEEDADRAEEQAQKVAETKTAATTKAATKGKPGRKPKAQVENDDDTPF
jgi:hypothetical protein